MIRRLAILTFVLFAACGDSKPATNPTPANSNFLLPGFLPTGFKIQAGSVLTRGPKHDVFGVALGRPVGRGNFDGVILVTATDAAKDREVAANEKNSTVDIGPIKARLHDDATVGAYVDWFANGAAVSVSGPPGTSAVVTDIARRVEGGTLADMRLATAPTGYAEIASGHFTTYAPDAGTALNVGGPSNARITVTTAETDVPLAFVVGGGEHLETMTIRGHDALASTRTILIQGVQVKQRLVAWRERPGFVITLIANTPPEQLVPFATGLSRVTEAEWRRIVPQP